MLKPKFVLITNVCTHTLTILYGIFYIHISKGEKNSFGLGKGVSRNGEERDGKDKKKKDKFVSIFFGPNRKQIPNTGNVVFLRSGEGQQLVGGSRC